VVPPAGAYTGFCARPTVDREENKGAYVKSDACAGREWLRCRGRFGNGTVHLRAAGGYAVELPLPGHADHPVAVRPQQVQVRERDSLLSFTHLGKDLARENRPWQGQQAYSDSKLHDVL
jgi:hypothetical protein